MAYLAILPLEEEKRLAPKFEGGNRDLKLDMMLPQGFVAHEMDFSTCFQLHVRVPPELTNSVPGRIVVRLGKGEYLPDFGLAPWGGWGLVSQSFVEIVEQLEPNANQFLPIAETVDQSGRLIEKRFFLMNILQQFNAVDVERSSVQVHESHRTTRAVDGTEKSFAIVTMEFLKPYKLVLKKALIAGHHLWHGTNQDIYQVFFSQKLYEAVRAANLSALEYLPAGEI